MLGSVEAMNRALLVLLLALAVSPLAACKRADSSGATSATANRYSTRGTVKSFGPGRAFVNVEHEDIPGYMKSMTMSFEPRTADQIEGLKEGDRVKLSFTDEGDRRLIDTIE